MKFIPVRSSHNIFPSLYVAFSFAWFMTKRMQIMRYHFLFALYADNTKRITIELGIAHNLNRASVYCWICSLCYFNRQKCSISDFASLFLYPNQITFDTFAFFSVFYLWFSNLQHSCLRHFHAFNMPHRQFQFQRQFIYPAFTKMKRMAIVFQISISISLKCDKRWRSEQLFDRKSFPRHTLVLCGDMHFGWSALALKNRRK